MKIFEKLFGSPEERKQAENERQEAFENYLKAEEGLDAALKRFDNLPNELAQQRAERRAAEQSRRESLRSEIEKLERELEEKRSELKQS